jgi:tuberous sclerosis protein 2
MGHSALYTMCRILEDAGVAHDVCLLRGAVFHINMGLWGTKRVTSLMCTFSSVLPSFLAVSMTYSVPCCICTLF